MRLFNLPRTSHHPPVDCDWTPLPAAKHEHRLPFPSYYQAPPADSVTPTTSHDSLGHSFFYSVIIVSVHVHLVIDPSPSFHLQHSFPLFPQHHNDTSEALPLLSVQYWSNIIPVRECDDNDNIVCSIFTTAILLALLTAVSAQTAFHHGS